MSAAKKEFNRSGILAGGNWIIDQVKMIDVYPQREQLANIAGPTVTGTGGSPYNLLVNFAKLGVIFPLSAAGLVGKDSFGKFILDDCKKHKIDTKFLTVSSDAPTSYTDVMTESKGGNRTFFHNQGSNAIWDGGDIDFSKTKAKFFHLGYLLLMQALDGTDKKFGTINSLINCAAYTNVDGAESDKKTALQVNGSSVGYLAKKVEDYNSFLIHISTDYVFGNENIGPYSNKDKTSPINYYGYTKLEGEKEIKLKTDKHLIIRTSSLI